MQGRRAAEGDEGARARILAALDGVDARGIGHVLVYHLADAERGQLGRELQPVADDALHRRRGAGGVQRQPAAGKRRGIDAPEDEIGVGDGGLAAAAPVADGPRLGPGAVGADADAAQRVDARDRAAAGADLDHLDDGDAQRQAAALLETVDARHLEDAAGLRLGIVDEADLGGRAAHVVGQHLREAALLRHVAREDGAAGRTGFDQPHREADRRRDGGDAAARHHQEQRTGEACGGEVALEIGEIAPHQRLDIGVGAGGGEALVFAHLRRHVAGERHREMRQAFRQ